MCVLGNGHTDTTFTYGLPIQFTIPALSSKIKPSFCFPFVRLFLFIVPSLQLPPSPLATPRLLLFCFDSHHPNSSVQTLAPFSKCCPLIKIP